MTPVDVVAIGAHPDDVEMTIGGTIAKLVSRGKSVAIVDLTRGEMGSNGTPELRATEAAAAAAVLGVSQRYCLDMGDGTLENSLKNRTAVMEILRELRPKIVFANHWHDLHPDHMATGSIVRDIMYPIGFRKFPAKGQAYRPHEFLFYMSHFPFEPSFVIDVTDHHETKLESVRCYASQLFNHHFDQVPTLIGDPEFVRRLEGRARHYGAMIQRRFGEPIFVSRAVPMDDVVDHYAPFTKI
jgi:bacillithiol biosynthesis deacetylase BshB1